MREKTIFECYGVNNYSNTQEFKEREYNTKKLNNTFNTSKPEEHCYHLLLTKFSKNDIIRQYKSDLYPFSCDFYIKSLDLYIEYNGHWTHGKESFNKTNKKHQEILNNWKKKLKNSKFYTNAIKVWTDLDVRKLETFKKNKLNYKIFWNIKEVKDFIGGI